MQSDDRLCGGGCAGEALAALALLGLWIGLPTKLQHSASTAYASAVPALPPPPPAARTPPPQAGAAALMAKLVLEAFARLDADSQLKVSDFAFEDPASIKKVRPLGGQARGRGQPEAHKMCCG